MAGIVYGLFENKDKADEAITYVQSKNTHADVNAFVHEGYVRDEDVQITGTAATKWAAGGAISVALGISLIALLVLAPRAGMELSLFEFGLVFLGGTIFGVIAGVVAGASEAKAEIRKMANKVGDGRVMVTLDVPQGDPKRMVGLLEESGALEVKAA
jgi:hypothetical protein